MDHLRKLQLVVLSIAKDIDRLCRENGIEYYLGGGGAIGAIRHKGYIPWDDDLDFLMTYDHYERFVEVCKTKLDPDKYLLQLHPQGIPCLKIRLKGTKIVEKGKAQAADDTDNVFLDVFRLEKAPEQVWKQKMQYYFSKVYVGYALSRSGYIAPNNTKKAALALASCLRVPIVKKFVEYQIMKYNKKKDVNVFACLWGITRFKNTFTRKEIYGKPLYVPFEDTTLAMPEQYDTYLTQFFGNYMQLPPVEKRVAPHIVSIDLGKYEKDFQ